MFFDNKKESEPKSAAMSFRATPHNAIFVSDTKMQTVKFLKYVLNDRKMCDPCIKARNSLLLIVRFVLAFVRVFLTQHKTKTQS